MIIYSKLLWFADGLTVSPRLIIMHPRCRGDVALLAHERVHQAQMRKVGTLTFWWRYLTDKTFRMTAEVEAYKVSIAHGDSLGSSAQHLSTIYRLGITYYQALTLLAKKRG